MTLMQAFLLGLISGVLWGAFVAPWLGKKLANFFIH